MPDLSIVPGSVAPITTGIAGSILPTVTARGVAGVAIAPGQVVYADPSAGNLIKLAQASNQTQAQNVMGIAMGSAALNQPISYATSGDITLPTSGTVGSGSVLMSGSVYILSVNPGNIVSTADNLVAGNFVTVLGIGNGAASGTITPTFRLGIIPAAAQK